MHSRHVIGLQETRIERTGVCHYGPFTAYTTTAQAGQEGCQLWVRFGSPIGRDGQGQPLFFEPSTFMIRHDTPTQLLVTGDACKMRFLFVVAHAPTSQKPALELQRWWRELADAIRAVPRGRIPLLMIDANAHFTGATDTASTDRPGNANAKHLQALASEMQTALSPTIDSHWQQLVTWISPKGDPYCIDYIALPEQWHGSSRTFQPQEFPDHFAGIDHHPVYLDFQAQLAAHANPRARISARALQTPEGQHALQQAWNTIPCIPWAVDVDTHLRAIHDHLRHSLLSHVNVSAKPRSPVIRPSTWQLLRLQRGHRRLLRRMKQHGRKELLQLLFQSWRVAGPLPRRHAKAATLRRLALRAGTLAQNLVRLNQRIKRAFCADQALFSREMLQQARGDGDLYHHLRAVLKTGRRYKAPTALPALVTPDGDRCHDRDAFLQCLGLHFATAERAVAQEFSELQSEPGHIPVDEAVQVMELPTLEAYAAGFSHLKTGKASGISGLPAEVFRASPLQAARAHFPILLKSASNGRSPTLWRGGLAAPIAKPGKDLTSVKGWRSILLLEPSQKALGAAVRPALLQALDGLTHPGLAGARRGMPLSLPSMLVSLHISMLCRDKASGGVLFLDGESAFYNTVRAFLHPESPECHLRGWVNHLRDKGYLTHEQYATLSHKDILSPDAVPGEVKHLLRTLLQGTWYTTNQTQAQVFRTHYGTVPGAPLADILCSHLYHLH